MKKLPFLFFFISSSLLHAQNYNLTLRSHVSYAPNTGSNIWGYVDSTGREYALMGTSFGVSIVDVSNPDSPRVLFNVHTANSEWREIKTFRHYAYATNEDDSGVLIIDLSQLPNKVSQTTFSYVPELGTSITRSHTLWIDEKGKLYLFGSNFYQFGTYTGALIFDLNADPLHPKYLGNYTPNSNFYIHDGFVRGDTLWASEIYDGYEEVIDVSDPANGESLARFPTTSFFTHNSWPTHDDHYVFTTDEVPGSYLTAYDVSNLSNITEIDRIQHNPGTNPIIHNVHLLSDSFAVCSYYTEGALIYDVTYPDDMVEVGHYDLYPASNSGFFNGTWGVYPYLPSHTLIASNIEDGLYVLTPHYQHAWWLRGNITDSNTSAPIFKADIKVLGLSLEDSSDLLGNYKTGSVTAGTFDVQISKPKYVTKTIHGVQFDNGKLTNLDVALVPASTFNADIQILDSISNDPLDSVPVQISDNSGLNYSQTASSDRNGRITLDNIYPGNYSVLAGKWSFETKLFSAQADSTNNHFIYYLSRKYYDDFSFDNGWKVSGNAISGIWTRAVPVGTYEDGYPAPINPAADVNNDFSNECFVTGNGGGSENFDDVDAGETILTSPPMDLSAYKNPVISYYLWFADRPYGSNAPNDSFQVWVSNGSESKLADLRISSNTSPDIWKSYSFHLNDFVPSSDNVTVQFVISDQTNHDNAVEGGVDKFAVSDDVLSAVSNIGVNSAAIAKCFPTVFSNRCQFQLSSSFHDLSNLKVEIVNLMGEIVSVKNLGTGEKSFYWGEDLPQGMYHLIVLENGRLIGTTAAIKITE